MADLLVKLYDMEFRDYGERMAREGIVVKRAFISDKPRILDFIRQAFPQSQGWVYECEYALSLNPGACYIAVHQKRVVGFACYDASAKGFFGPTGVDEAFRGKGIGAQLLMKCLWSMREQGYAYAVIGWSAESAVEFYKRQTGAIEIPDSPPEKSIYRNMVDIE